MLTADPTDVLALAHERRDRFGAEAAAHRLRTSSGMRHALAAILRGTADRLESPALTPGPPLHPPILVNGR
jgi:hypothetical protein